MSRQAEWADDRARGTHTSDWERIVSEFVWFKDQNYSILRMLWSLRAHPHRDDFEARWWLAFPQHEVARTMMSSRSFSWPAMEAAAQTRKPAASPRQLLHPAVYLGSADNGQVRFLGRFSTEIQTSKDTAGKTVTKTVSTWFDSVQNQKFTPPESNAILPTAKERGLPLNEPSGVAGGNPPAGFTKLLSLDPASLPEYLREVAGG